jgi:hypothetical protein
MLVKDKREMRKEIRIFINADSLVDSEGCDSSRSISGGGFPPRYASVRALLSMSNPQNELATKIDLAPDLERIVLHPSYGTLRRENAYQ